MRRRHLPRLCDAAALAGLVAAALAVGSQVFGGPVRYVVVAGHSMEPALHTGDLAVLLREPAYGRGDVVAFRIPAGEPGAGGVVIHRVVAGSGRGYATQGDNRDRRDPWHPTSADVIGRVAFHIPKIGLVPAFLASPLGLGLAAGLIALLVLLGGEKPRRMAAPEPPVAAKPLPAREPAGVLALAAGALTLLAICAISRRVAGPGNL